MAVWSGWHARVHRTLRSRTSPSAFGKHQLLLPKGCRILVAVSGGQDSQCLLRLLIDLQSKWGWQLQAVHCNHRWRTDANDNADFVAQVLQRWHIPYTLETAEQPPKSEAAARQWRYQVFEKIANQTGYTHIVTGHTASDRAETLLYNLVRGSGADGLQALAWRRSLSDTAPDISLVRPLLDITRAETAQFCQVFNIPVWQDTTNNDRSYARNRLRLDVLPLLRNHFNPKLDTTLAHTAELLAADVNYLEAEAARLAQSCIDNNAIQRRSLRTAPVALQRRVIRQFLRQHLSTSPQFEHIEKVVVLLNAANRSQSDPFPGGAIAIVKDPWILLQDVSTGIE
ncbi:tRNA lysidine(34) synthetase TilS [Oscillatoria sp. CS-180]|uniref:tRNA lysidine(34) synthetase TilS n=1 Tax=Oscillatoria sp. CS-180 TaxID=3021720 RepID=UPI00232E3486|nr:tRNA lysidine(34) synthetase TilS [Oscillatoria sp. CS-180]MDB9528864.1 tRNA lysidine(34) synthetase TilS [Oscillatoria sp. CS-180]